MVTIVAYIVVVEDILHLSIQPKYDLHIDMHKRLNKMEALNSSTAIMKYNTHNAYQNFCSQTSNYSLPYLFASAQGRTGNALFQLSSLYGLSMKSSHRPIFNDKDLVLSQAFPNLKSSCIVNKTPVSSWLPYISEHACAIHEDSILTNITNKSYRIGRWLQSWKYFREYFIDIRELLKFSDKYLQLAHTELNSIRSSRIETTVFVGIHIRRGDMISPQLVEVGYRVVNSSYIIHAMDYFRRRYSHVHFIVCSDSPDWFTSQFNSTDFSMAPNTPRKN